MDGSTPITRRRLVTMGAAGAATVVAATGKAAMASAAQADDTVDSAARVSILDYQDRVPNQDAPRAQWDWSAALQAAIDENPGRVIHIPDQGDRYRISTVISLREKTTLAGDGYSTIFVVGDPGGEAGVFQLREQKVIDNPTTAFTHGIRVQGISFERAKHRRAGVIRLVNVRDAVVQRCRFVNCGGLTVTHELDVNGAYRPDHQGQSGDPAVEAGFSLVHTDDLNEDVVFSGNDVDGVDELVHGCRLSWVKRAFVTDNIGRHADLSWWGGSPVRDQGGSLQHRRRCLQVVATGNHLSGADTGIHGSCGSDLTVVGNVVEYVGGVAFAMAGCTNYVVDANVVRYAGEACYGVAYASENGVFSNNVAVQGHAAATRDGSGRHVFRRLEPFADERPHQYAVRGNTFVWEDDAGFGVFSTGSGVQADITGNHFVDVVVEGTGGNAKAAQMYDEVFHENDLRFTNATKAGDVYVQLGDQRRNGANVLSVQDNTLRIDHADPAAIPLVVQQGNPGKGKLTVVAGTVIDADTDIAIAYVDWSEASQGRRQYVEFTDNKVRGGIVKNLSTHPNEDSTVVRGLENNTNFALERLEIDTSADSRRFADLHFGPAVG